MEDSEIRLRHHLFKFVSDTIFWSRKFVSDTIYWLVAALLTCSGCAGIDPYNIIGRQIGGLAMPVEVVPGQRKAELDAEERIAAFDFVWSTINERYYDSSLNGVDWKAAAERYRPQALKAANDHEFWDVLDRMTGELRDSHTRVESPRQVALRKLDQSVTLGFSFIPLEGKLAVTSVNSSTDAWWAGVRPGMTLVSIAGMPAMEEYQRLIAGSRFDSTERARHMRAVRRIVAGEEGTKVAFVFERADGSRLETTLGRSRLTFHPSAAHRMLPTGFGYLRLTQWTIGVMPSVFAGLRELRSTPGLVVDLRGNPGGSLHAVNALLEKFFPKRTELGHTRTRTGKSVSMLFGALQIIKLKAEVEGDAEAYTGPVVILVNDSSGSGSEYFAATMQAVGRAVVVGEPSCGCLLGFLGYASIPGGGELAYSEVGFVMSNGRRIEGEGVIPNHIVPRTLIDLQMSRDRALEQAEATLRSLPGWKQ